MHLARHSAKGPPAGIEEAAAYWLARRSLGLMTSREETAFDVWRADPDCAAAYEAAATTMDDVGAIAADMQMRQMRDAALASGPMRVSTRFPWRYGATVAAVLIAVLVANAWVNHPPGAFVDSSPSTLSPSTMASDISHVAIAPRRYATKVGERLNVALEDGSIVALNTASLIEVAYSPGRRDVRLLQGQALFRVAKNANRPFVVAAGGRRVTAVGTAFDVRVDADSVKVLLVEGRVTVEPIKLSGLERLVPALVRQELAPGEQLTFIENQPVAIAVADVDRDTSWRRGEVIFRDDTLAAAVTEMNRYSQTQIVVDDPRAARLRVSGVFGVERPENFIAALTAYYPLDAQRRSEGVTVLAWREGNRHGDLVGISTQE